MSRLQLFRSMGNHPIFKSAFKRLRKQEVALCEQFILENDGLDYGDFNGKLARWMIDDPNKPKNHSHMYGVVMAANPLPRKGEAK